MSLPSDARSSSSSLELASLNPPCASPSGLRSSPSPRSIHADLGGGEYVEAIVDPSWECTASVPARLSLVSRGLHATVGELHSLAGCDRGDERPLMDAREIFRLCVACR